jgi:hypothetical protein
MEWPESTDILGSNVTIIQFGAVFRVRAPNATDGHDPVPTPAPTPEASNSYVLAGAVAASVLGIFGVIAVSIGACHGYCCGGASEEEENTVERTPLKPNPKLYFY